VFARCRESAQQLSSRSRKKKKAIDGAGIDGLADRRLGQTTGGCGVDGANDTRLFRTMQLFLATRICGITVTTSKPASTPHMAYSTPFIRVHSPSKQAAFNPRPGGKCGEKNAPQTGLTKSPSDDRRTRHNQGHPRLTLTPVVGRSAIVSTGRPVPRHRVNRRRCGQLQTRFQEMGAGRLRMSRDVDWPKRKSPADRAPPTGR
jgi:hypothetical protein